MSPVLIAIAALVASDAGPGDGALVASSSRQVQRETEAVMVQALPRPPDVVVRKTKRYGEVTVDHAKHLTLRAPCSACHVTFPVGKIDFTPQVAHRACIGCHKERGSGPSQCAGCHVTPLPEREAVTAEAQPASAPESARGGDTPSAAAAAPAASPSSASASASATAAPSPAPRPAPAPARGVAVASDTPASRQIVEVGCVAGPGFGPSLRVSSRREALLTMYSFERVARGSDAHLVAMLGAGLSTRVHDDWEVVALAMAGFDTFEAPSVTIAPALGARAGVEWHPRRWRFETIHVGVTGVLDLSHGRADAPGTLIFATVATGLSVRAKPVR
jgi:hypothetical protein